MTLVERLLTSPSAKIDLLYHLVQKAFEQDSDVYRFQPHNGRLSDALRTELDRGLYAQANDSDIKTYLYRGRYSVAVRRRSGSRVDIFIEIPNRRHSSRSRDDFDFGPEPNMEGVDPDIWRNILRNREHVLRQVEGRYGLESLWNDHSGFVYLFKMNVATAFDDKTGKKNYPDEKEAIMKTEQFMRALYDWATNDPSC